MAKLTKEQSLSYIGLEPEEVNDRIDLVLAFNWYSYTYDPKIGALWLDSWLKKHKLGSTSTLTTINCTMCSIARMLSRGISLPNEEKWLRARIKEYQSKKVVDTVSKQFYVEDLNPLIMMIDEELDKFYRSDYKYFDVEIYNYIQDNEIKQTHIQAAYTLYDELLEEIQIEGLYNLTSKQLKNYIKFISRIKFEIQLHFNKKRATRKPRKQRVSSGKLKIKSVMNLKIKTEDRELKVNSVTPESIVGAKECWIYNTKYKKLTCLIGNSLTVSGTTIKGWDVKKSKSRTLRKPETLLSEFQNAAPKIRHTMFDKLTTKLDPNFSGRCGDDTILLKTIK